MKRHGSLLLARLSRSVVPALVLSGCHHDGVATCETSPVLSHLTLRAAEGATFEGSPQLCAYSYFPDNAGWSPSERAAQAYFAFTTTSPPSEVSAWYLELHLAVGIDENATTYPIDASDFDPFSSPTLDVSAPAGRAYGWARYAGVGTSRFDHAGSLQQGELTIEGPSRWPRVAGENGSASFLAEHLLLADGAQLTGSVRATFGLSAAARGERPAASSDRGQPPVMSPRTYAGQAECVELLARYLEVQGDPYGCPGRPLESGGTERLTAVNGSCVRDTYVNVALQHCWAAECYASLGVTQATVDAGQAASTPEAEAVKARQSLDEADKLCSDVAVVMREPACGTEEIHICP